MICELTTKDGKPDWCERHRTYHVGRLRDLSQLDDDLGEKYRRSWDVALKTRGHVAVTAEPRKGCNCR